jgi:hypothetical protein
VAFVGGPQLDREWLPNYLKDKGVEWTQVVAASDGGRWYPPPFDAYDVRYVPLYLLLDREGRIVSANPTRAALGPAIEEALARP